MPPKKADKGKKGAKGADGPKEIDPEAYNREVLK
jgi:hypothetical protein